MLNYLTKELQTALKQEFVDTSKIVSQLLKPFSLEKIEGFIDYFKKKHANSPYVEDFAEYILSTTYATLSIPYDRDGRAKTKEYIGITYDSASKYVYTYMDDYVDPVKFIEDTRKLLGKKMSNYEDSMRMCGIIHTHVRIYRMFIKLIVDHSGESWDKAIAESESIFGNVIDWQLSCPVRTSVSHFIVSLWDEVEKIVRAESA